jgi:hypothetical protein
MLFFFCNTAWRRHCKRVSFCGAPPRKRVSRITKKESKIVC